MTDTTTDTTAAVTASLATIAVGIAFMFLFGAIVMWLGPIVWAGFTLGWGQCTLLVFLLRLCTARGAR